jgi:hypothetical protein
VFVIDVTMVISHKFMNFRRYSQSIYRNFTKKEVRHGICNYLDALLIASLQREISYFFAALP